MGRGPIAQVASRNSVSQSTVKGTNGIQLPTTADDDTTFELTFNLDFCFSPNLGMQSAEVFDEMIDGQDVHLESLPKESPCLRGDGSYNSQSFEIVAAHELGHVLGLGHPGEKGYFLDSNTNHAVNDFVSINHTSAGPCGGLQFFKQKEECHKAKTTQKCAKLAACEVRASTATTWTCQNIFHRTIMAAHSSRDDKFVLRLTANDIAGMYFMYPHQRAANPNEWVNADFAASKLPLMWMSLPKLRYMLYAEGKGKGRDDCGRPNCRECEECTTRREFALAVAGTYHWYQNMHQHATICRNSVHSSIDLILDSCAELRTNLALIWVSHEAAKEGRKTKRQERLAQLRNGLQSAVRTLSRFLFRGSGDTDGDADQDGIPDKDEVDEVSSPQSH
jgi:hypothetical protein